MASSSLRLFKTFSQRSPPNSEPCFLSFSSTTHYPGHVEETMFREKREGDLEKDSKKWREREREKRAKNKSEPERKRQRELMSD